MEGYDGNSCRDQLQDDRGHHVGQSKDAQDEEVEGQEKIYIFFTKYLNTNKMLVRFI